MLLVRGTRKLPVTTFEPRSTSGQSDRARYVPAAGRSALTRLYDPVVALTTRERRFRALLGDDVKRDLPPGATVVDVGCGTGTFALAVAAARCRPMS